MTNMSQNIDIQNTTRIDTLFERISALIEQTRNVSIRQSLRKQERLASGVDPTQGCQHLCHRLPILSSGQGIATSLG